MGSKLVFLIPQEKNYGRKNTINMNFSRQNTQTFSLENYYFKGSTSAFQHTQYFEVIF